MRVFSAFNGKGCAWLALDRAGITVTERIASEIDKQANIVNDANYPDTIHVGDITKVKNLGKIDLIVGGSPCQGFSYAGKGLNFDDPRSKLFFEFVRILSECRSVNPGIKFMLENVNMLQEWQDVISEHIGCQPIFINSRDFSAQDRKRLYWTNIPVDGWQPRDVKWSDICEDGGFAGAMRGRRINEHGKRDDYNKDIKIVQYIESRMDDKTNCLTTVGKDNIVSSQRVGRTPLNEVEWRYMTRNEMERLQTVPDNYTAPVSAGHAGRLLGNGWTVDVVAHILKNLGNGQI